MNAVTIRPATLEDLETVVELNHLLYENAHGYDPRTRPRYIQTVMGRDLLARQLTGSDAYTTLAEMSDKTVGFACGALLPHDGGRPARTAELIGLYVREGFRGQGIGTQLVHAVERWAKTRKVRTLQVSHYVGNTAAGSLYANRGYNPLYITAEKDLST